MSRYPDVLTTTEAAKIVRVTPGVLRRLCDEGKIPYYRIPGSTHRRIQRAAIIKFMKDNGIPLENGETNASSSHAEEESV